MIIFHRIIAVIALLSYIYILVSNDTGCSIFSSGCAPMGQSSKGEGIVYILPLLSMLCLAFPEYMSLKYSPRFGIMNERLLRGSFYTICGYLGLFLSYYLLKLF